ncbi:AraC family transcriptional regulator [Algiphilus sp.]|uniref:AraC family transcriptional regulator n=1 Tax=Algiphilus sp. TaxID=1872431 RepID=UPI003BAADC00
MHTEIIDTERFSIASTSIDQALVAVSRAFQPHDVEVTERCRGLNFAIEHWPLRALSLTRVRYGRQVDVDCGPLDGFYLIQMPVLGGAQLRTTKGMVQTHSKHYAVMSVDQPVPLRLLADCDAYVLKISERRLRETCALLLGHEPADAISFATDLSTCGDNGRRWHELLQFFVADLRYRGSELDSPLRDAQMEQLVISTLLMAQPSNVTDALRNPARPLDKVYVRKARDYIEEHAAEPITIEHCARHAGVSTRALFAGFRRYLGTTPMAYLKAVRLRRVHADLQNPQSGMRNVTEAAYRWGFTHLSNFAADYKERFGERPSETFRRRSRVH